MCELDLSLGILISMTEEVLVGLLDVDALERTLLRQYYFVLKLQ